MPGVVVTDVAAGCKGRRDVPVANDRGGGSSPKRRGWPPLRRSGLAAAESGPGPVPCLRRRPLQLARLAPKESSLPPSMALLDPAHGRTALLRGSRPTTATTAQLLKTARLSSSFAVFVKCNSTTACDRASRSRAINVASGKHPQHAALHRSLDSNGGRPVVDAIALATPGLTRRQQK